MVVLCVATLWVTTKNAPFSDRNKSFQTFLKTFEIASQVIIYHMSLFLQVRFTRFYTIK